MSFLSSRALFETPTHKHTNELSPQPCVYLDSVDELALPAGYHTNYIQRKLCIRFTITIKVDSVLGSGHCSLCLPVMEAG